jgi:hypothetical protein
MEKAETGQLPEWKKYCRPEPNVVARTWVPGYGERYTRDNRNEPTDEKYPGKSAYEKSDWHTDRTACWTAWRSLKHYHDPEWSSTGSRQEIMLRSGAASANSRGPRNRNGGHRYSRALPMEQPRNPISAESYRLFYKAAGSLRHSQSRGLDSGRCASSSASSEYCGGYIVSRAVTSNLVWYRRFFNFWE